ncbi:MAG: helix-turn-helix transcriptional regulator [bacterium]|nr:helix-turn-helix transcriptional regulator [bacterium]
MAKPLERSYSRYTVEAVSLLGQLIRLARIEKGMTAQGLADRAGISRGLLQRIEKGDPRCELGAALELATILGIPLFASDAEGLQQQGRQVSEKLALLPRAVHPKAPVVNDDF